MRKIVGQYITTNGDLKAIYDVSKSTFRHKDIELGAEYEVAYRLGRGEGYINSTLEQVSDGNRTLFFRNPDNPLKLIGIPIFNILRYYKK